VISPSSIEFTPTQLNEEGFHLVTIELYDDFGGSIQKSFTVEVFNEAPYFTLDPLPSYKIGLNSVVIVNIREFEDYEGNTVIMEYKEVIDGVDNPLSSYQTFVYPYSLNISPKDF